MALQYININKNKDKKIIDSVFKDLVICVHFINQKLINNKKNDFNVSFEITTILLFSLFFGSKLNNNNEFKNNNQFLMDLFVKDLDYSFRNIGVGDMSIGKYVKKYVKKFYFRISQLEIIFLDKNSNKFNEFLDKYRIIDKNDENNIS